LNDSNIEDVIKKKKYHSSKFVSCLFCKEQCYCSDQCRIQDWYGGHQIVCTGKERKNKVSNEHARLIEEESAFIKEGKILKDEEIKVQKLKIEDFEIVNSKVLGKGSYGEVELAKHKSNGRLFALKKIDKNNIANLNVKTTLAREVLVHKRLVHDNIIRLYNSFEDERYIYLVLEYAPSGTLFHYIRGKKKLTEDEAFYFFIQSCAGVYYLHKHGMIHRDIKPENLLIGEGSVLKICDFGWCVQSSGQSRSTFCGTLEYMAPEMIQNGLHNETLDIWCLGILLYELLHGHAPFRGETPNEICRQIMNSKILFSEEVAEEAQDLIRGLLKRDVNERMPLVKVFVHPWVKKFELKHGIKKIPSTQKKADLYHEKLPTIIEPKSPEQIVKELKEQTEALKQIERKSKNRKTKDDASLKITNGFFEEKSPSKSPHSNRINSQQEENAKSPSPVRLSPTLKKKRTQSYDKPSPKEADESAVDENAADDTIEEEQEKTSATHSSTSNQIVKFLEEDEEEDGIKRHEGKILDQVENFIKYQPKKIKKKKPGEEEEDEIMNLCSQMNKALEEIDLAQQKGQKKKRPRKKKQKKESKVEKSDYPILEENDIDEDKILDKKTTKNRLLVHHEPMNEYSPMSDNISNMDDYLYQDRGNEGNRSRISSKSSGSNLDFVKHQLKLVKEKQNSSSSMKSLHGPNSAQAQEVAKVKKLENKVSSKSQQERRPESYEFEETGMETADVTSGMGSGNDSDSEVQLKKYESVEGEGPADSGGTVDFKVDRDQILKNMDFFNDDLEFMHVGRKPKAPINMADKYLERNAELNKNTDEKLRIMEERERQNNIKSDGSNQGKEFLKCVRRDMKKNLDNIPIDEIEKKKWLDSRNMDTDLKLDFMPPSIIYSFSNYEKSLQDVHELLKDKTPYSRHTLGNSPDGKNSKANRVKKGSFLENSELQNEDFVDDYERKRKLIKEQNKKPHVEMGFWQRLFPFCTEKR